MACRSVDGRELATFMGMAGEHIDAEEVSYDLQPVPFTVHHCGRYRL